MTDWVALFPSSCFQQTMLGLAYEHPAEGQADLFSRGCVAFFVEKASDTYGYQFTQIFEETVLNEVIVLNRLSAEDVYALRCPDTPAIARLRDLAARADALPLPVLANTIAALISISRFRVASTLLEGLRARPLAPREAFELGWLEYLISNRFSDGRDTPAAFARMRRAVDAGAVPVGRILDLCTQGVVWHLKRQEVDEATFRWCLETGTRLAGRTEHIDVDTISSWFRGLAMLPAARRYADATHEFMERARTMASRSIAKGASPRALNALKTCLESSIKEFLYVKPDHDRALQAARDLIALDPAWSPSYGECAEVHAKFGRDDLAGEYYERAASLGPPFFGHHLLMAARSRAKAGDLNRATEHYGDLVGFAPNDHRLLAEAEETLCGSLLRIPARAPA
jgi:tetratricopeptide (TPR) repeat protein